MKIKIVNRWSNLPMIEEDDVYDIYYGFTGIPITLPFCTKWKLYKAGITKEELLEWLEENVCAYQKVIIKL